VPVVKLYFGRGEGRGRFEEVVKGNEGVRRRGSGEVGRVRLGCRVRLVVGSERGRRLLKRMKGFG
jgi:hypothetical protein